MRKILTIFILCYYLSSSYDLELRLNLENPNLIGEPEIFFGPIECGEYVDSELSSISFGFVNRYRVYRDFGFYLNAGYGSFSGEFSRNDIFTSRNDIDFSLQDVETKTSVSFDYNNMILGGGLSYFLDDILLGGVRFDLGSSFLIPTNGVFDQEEIIVSPDNAVFLAFDNAQKRDLQVGSLETLQSVVMLSTRITNFVKVGKIVNLTQSIEFTYATNSMFSDAKNNYYSINYGFGIALSKRNEESLKIDEPSPVPPKVEPLPLPKDTIVPVPQATAKLEVISNWEDYKLKTGEELLSSLPLVNSIFFEKNSHKIKDQIYNDEEFDNFSGDALKAHERAIFRISKIIKQKPDSRIEIIGYTSGKENEPEGIDLAQKRAENLKKKFIELGIDSDKIETNSRLLPPAKSNLNFKKGIEENQRADIKLINAPTQEYVALQKFSVIEGEILAKVDFENLDKLELTNSINGDKIVVKEPGEYKFVINKRIPKDVNQLESETKLLFADSSIKHKEFIDLKSLSKINMNYDLSKFEAVIRFDYNSSELSKENKELLKQLIELLPNNSEIKILGSADAIGSAETNKILEEKRAKNTQKFIESIKDDKNFDLSTGRTKNKFPEDTPQGRFLNRSIRIKVEAK